MTDDDISSLIKEKLSLSKNKPAVNILLIGHVDAGKSTIGGRMLVDLGIVDARTVEKYRIEAEKQNRASWYLSWCMDINPEERERGKTQELGISNAIELEKVVVNMLDAPGHKQYIDNMIEGASKADLGILVVSARGNEFESGFMLGGQTKEHIKLLRAGNCSNIAVLVNKMDECDWDENRYNVIKTKISAFVQRIFSSSTLQVIPVSGYYGDNILNKKKLDYYDGPTFIEYLNSFSNITPYKSSNKDLSILTVVEKSKLNNCIGISVQVNHGKIHKNVNYACLGTTVKTDKITSIFNTEEVEIDETTLNNTYKVKFSKIFDELSIGNKLVYPLELAKMFVVSTNFRAEIQISKDVDSVVTAGFSFVLHCNLQTLGGKIASLYDVKTMKRVHSAKAGKRFFANITADNEVVFQCNKNHKDLFSLRILDETVGVGKFLKNNNK